MTSEGNQESEHSRSKVYEWQGRLAIVGYTGSPYLEDPWDLERGSPEARAGTFLLSEVSDLGLMARRLMREVVEARSQLKFDDPIFIPWASVHSIRPLEVFSESSESDK